MTDEGHGNMLEFPLDGELVDAVRLAEALERVEAGRPSGVDPIEDPALAGLVETAARLRADLGVPVAGQGFHSFRWRSRAAVLHALEDEPALGGVAAGAPANVTALPARDRSIVARALRFGPIAATAAAVSIIAALLAGGGTLGATRTPSSGGEDRMVGERTLPAGGMLGPDAGGAAPVAAARSTDEELDHLAIVIADIQARSDSGQPVPAPLLRAVSEGAAKVANAIEQRPEQVSKATVTNYINTAQTTQSVLSNVTVEQDAQGALAVAQRTSRDGEVVAARFLAAKPEPTPVATSTAVTVRPTATATATPASTATATASATASPTPTPTATASPTPTPTATEGPTPTSTPAAGATRTPAPVETATTAPTASPTAAPTSGGADDIVR